MNDLMWAKGYGPIVEEDNQSDNNLVTIWSESQTILPAFNMGLMDGLHQSFIMKSRKAKEV
ncbi:MAG: hypothetical protein ACRCW2_07620 [Cellulosilyticaceae bacterium]